MRTIRLAVLLAVVSLLLPSTTGPAAAAPVNLNATNSYVISVYEDLFDRSPDPGGLATWTTALNRGTPRVAVANAITSSEEFRTGLINDAYATYLGRGPDPVGLRSWLQNMGAGMTVEQLHSGFIASDEYWAAAGGMSEAWVRALYADVLGREAGGSEVSYWLSQLDGGASRSQVALGFLLSTEHLSSVVDGYYWWLLGRGLDPTGQSTWVAAIQQGARDEQVIGAIIASEEYWTNESTRPHVGFIVLSPMAGTFVTLGAQWRYTVTAYSANGAPIGDVTDEAHVTWAGQPCVRGLCRPTSVGTHEIHAVHRMLNDWETLTVAPVG